MSDGQFIERGTLDLWSDTMQEQRDTITTLRAQLAKAQAERDDAIIKRAAWELEAKIQEARADRAEAQLAEAQAKRDADTPCYWPSCSHTAKGQCLPSIRAKPHDRTALDRMLAEAREKALREAAAAADELADEVDRGHDWGERASSRILALIEKPNAR